MPDTPPSPDDYADLRAIIIDALNPRRYGWKRSQINQQLTEYILQRDAVLRAIAEVHQVDWRNIMPHDQELASKIRENALHALATLIQAMRRIEIDHI